jgi:N-glycosylase/DNA lyase
MEIIKKILELKQGSIRQVVNTRLRQFSELQEKGNEEWFSELCFCLLTANTSAELGISVQNKLGYKGFTQFKDEKELALRLKQAKYRFYNRRAHFIALANKHKKIKTILTKIKDDNEKREWLVQNIKGLGYKESSHFLRNVGYLNFAILDKHIIKLMHKSEKIKQIPKTMTKAKYLEIEKRVYEIADYLNMNPGELDLYMWYIATGKVLK